MILGIMNNDWENEPGFFYTNDAPVWEGLRDYAQALQEIGAALEPAGLRGQGTSAGSLRDRITMLRCESRSKTPWSGRESESSFVHIHPVLDNRQAAPCVYLTDMRHRAHRRFHEWPRLVGTDFLTDAERRCIFDYEFNHEQTVLGVRRFVPAILDNFQCYNSAYQKLRLGMVREYLMEYYGTIQAFLGPGFGQASSRRRWFQGMGRKEGGMDTGSTRRAHGCLALKARMRRGLSRV